MARERSAHRTGEYAAKRTLDAAGATHTGVVGVQSCEAGDCTPATRRVRGLGQRPKRQREGLSSAFFCRLMDHLKQFCLGFLHVLRCHQVRLLRGLLLQKRQGLS